MKVYKQIKQIAELNEKIVELCNDLVLNEIDANGLNFEHAHFIKNCVAEDGHLYDKDGTQLDNYGLVDDEYYCKQYRGYMEDEYYGTLYYATDEEDVFVAVPFAM